MYISVTNDSDSDSEADAVGGGDTHALATSAIELVFKKQKVEIRERYFFVSCRGIGLQPHPLSNCWIFSSCDVEPLMLRASHIGHKKVSLFDSVHEVTVGENYASMEF